MTKRKSSLSSGILLIGIFSLLAVGSWVSFDIYRAIVKTTVPKVLQNQLQPLNPEIDSNLVNSLRNRKKYDDSYLNTLQPKFLLDDESTVNTAPTPTPTPTEKVATNSSELNTPISTSSSTLSR
jgi:hypothetical protein